MKEEFIPYGESLDLKELGFDEECFAYYENQNEKLIINYNNLDLTEEQSKRPNLFKIETRNSKLPQWATSTPTYWGAFRWFRDKHGLYIHQQPEFYTSGINFNWQILWYLPKEEFTKYVINDGTGLYGDNGEFPTQEDMELACLRKLIEIVKTK